MRPLEIVLVVADLVALLLFVVRLPDKLRPLRYAIGAVPVALVAHLLIEGVRWPMAPAYALACLFLLRSLLPIARRAGWSAVRRRRSRLVAGINVGLGVVGLAVAGALPMVFPVFEFPRPAGPHAIGTVTFHWVDEDRFEAFTADTPDRRELMVQLWYPAAEPSSRRASYMDDEVVPALARLLHLPAFTLGHLKHVTTNATVSPPVATDQPRYPVLIFLEGLSGYRQMTTFQVEELVSRGYVVAAIDQPYVAGAVAFSGGRTVSYDVRMNDRAFLDSVIPFLARDVVFTLDRLTALNREDPNGVVAGRLDLARVGLFAHSLGGIVGAEACRLEPRLRACLLEDTVMPANVVRAGLQQPAMWITRDADTMRLERQRSGGWPEEAIHEHLTTMRSVFETLPTQGYYLEVPGMFHLDMTDLPLWSPLTSTLGVTGPIGGERAHQIINAYSVAFFDRHLRDHPVALLDGPAEQYPEVRIDTHPPLNHPGGSGP